jgi:glycosyltransferase involved in cell wall biosynthesis
MKISVVLAVYNEVENIAACLESVKSFCDEIIVVDGSSTDDTALIAKKCGAHVIVTDNKPMFHTNKQMAIDKARGDWVLQLDADERITPDLALEIQTSVHNEKINGYWIPRKNYFLGRFLMKGGVYPDYTLRLYRRGKGKLPQKNVHEQAVVMGNVGYLKYPLIHMADVHFSRYIYRFNRYTDLLAQEIKTENKNLIVKAGTYLFLKPVWWFASTYIRHKGFLDSWQGLVFSFFSALRFPVSFIKSFKMYANSSH